MVIVGIEINGEDFLPYSGGDNSSGYFRSFMHYCIDHYFDRIIMDALLSSWFCLIPNDPLFGADLNYNVIEEHNGIYFSMHLATKNKINRIDTISEKLRIDVFIHVID